MAIDPAKIEAVLALIESGSSENAACEEVGIHRSTFRQHALSLDLGREYARACVALARDQTDKLDAAIQDMRNGTISPEIGRIEVEARKWFASRLNRQLYGDRVAVAGPSGDGPVLAELTVKFV